LAKNEKLFFTIQEILYIIECKCKTIFKVK
jgi:hypothetical protein